MNRGDARGQFLSRSRLSLSLSSYLSRRLAGEGDRGGVLRDEVRRPCGELLRDLGLFLDGGLRDLSRPSRGRPRELNNASTPLIPSEVCFRAFFSFLRAFLARRSSGVSSLRLSLDFFFFGFFNAFSSLHFARRKSRMGSSGSISGPDSDESDAAASSAVADLYQPWVVV